MLNDAESHGASIVELMLETIIVFSGVVVGYVGFFGAAFLVGLLPLYIYGYFIIGRGVRLSSAKGRIWGAVALLSALTLLFYLWIIEAVMGMWAVECVYESAAREVCSS